MKTVKLDRRFRQLKEHGHTVALRFDTWEIGAQRIESQCRQRLGGSGWHRSAAWTSYYGSASKRTGHRPFWITFRNESDLTLVLLSVDLTN